MSPPLAARYWLFIPVAVVVWPGVLLWHPTLIALSRLFIPVTRAWASVLLLIPARLILILQGLSPDAGVRMNGRLIYNRDVDLTVGIALTRSIVTHDSKRSATTSRSVRFSRTILEFHALPSDDGAVFSIEPLVGRALGSLGGDTVKGGLVEDGSRWTLGSLVGSALFTIELESLRALRLVNRGAAFSVQIGTLGAGGFAADTGVSIECKSSTIRSCNRHTLAVLEGESRLAVLLSDTGAASILPDKVLCALWGLCTLTASIGVFLAGRAGWEAVNTVAILEVRVGGTLRGCRGKAQSILTEDCTLAALGTGF